MHVKMVHIADALTNQSSALMFEPALPAVGKEHSALGVEHSSLTIRCLILQLASCRPQYAAQLRPTSCSTSISAAHQAEAKEQLQCSGILVWDGAKNPDLAIDASHKNITILRNSQA